MIQEQYVSFDTAKILKEKGFNISCRDKYIDPESTAENAFPFFTDITDDEGIPCMGKNSELESYEYSAPTQSLAMRWLREVHNIAIVVYPCVTDDDGTAGCLWNFMIFKHLNLTDSHEDGNILHESYEQTAEEAIMQSLKFICNEN